MILSGNFVPLLHQMLIYGVGINPQEDFHQFISIHIGIVIHPSHVINKGLLLLGSVMLGVGVSPTSQIMGNVIVGVKIEIGVNATIHQFGHTLVELA